MFKGEKTASSLFVPALIVSLALLIAFLHARTPMIAGADSFYHLGHTRQYLKHGLLNSDFPWATASVIRTHAADLWYGFHIVLIPAAGAQNIATALKLSGILSLALSIAAFALALRHQRVALPFLWPFLLLLSSSRQLYRYMMLRPHTISFGFLALLLSFSVSGNAIGVMVCSFFITWTHFTIAWSVPMIAGIGLLSRGVFKSEWDWRSALACLGGVLIGIFLRPNPIGAIKLWYVQIVQLSLLKIGGVGLAFGAELKAFTISKFLDLHGALFILWIAAGSLLVFCFLMRNRRSLAVDPSFLWGTLTVSSAYLAMTLAMSRRATDQWSPFAIMAVAVAYTEVVRRASGRDPRGGREGKSPSFIPALAGRTHIIAPLAVVLLTAGLGLKVAERNKVAMNELVGIEPTRYKPAAEWIRSQSSPGEIVFQEWSVFSELFLWNDRNFYIGGMDPVFQYVYSPDLYKKGAVAQLEAKRRGQGKKSILPRSMGDLYTIVRQDFGASYWFVPKRLHRDNLGMWDRSKYIALSRNRQFQLVYDDREAGVFRVGKPAIQDRN